MAKKKAKKKVKKKAKKKTVVRKRKAPIIAKKRVTRAERELEEGLQETFPGSDPLAQTDPTRSIRE